MAAVRCLVEAKYMEDAQTTQYTAPANTRVIIDNMTVTNNTAANVIFSANIVPPGGSVAASNKVQQDTTVLPGTRMEFLLQGQYLSAGGSLSTDADTASGLVMRVNGREFQV
jgi:hypothetical protein